jgi:hypothetical protein
MVDHSSEGGFCFFRKVEKTKQLTLDANGNGSGSANANGNAWPTWKKTVGTPAAVVLTATDASACVVEFNTKTGTDVVFGRRTLK